MLDHVWTDRPFKCTALMFRRDLITSLARLDWTTSAAFDWPEHNEHKSIESALFMTRGWVDELRFHKINFTTVNKDNLFISFLLVINKIVRSICDGQLRDRTRRTLVSRSTFVGRLTMTPGLSHRSRPSTYAQVGRWFWSSSLMVLRRRSPSACGRQCLKINNRNDKNK